MKWQTSVCQTPRPRRYFVRIAGTHRVPCSRRLLPILSGCRRVGETSETTVFEQMIWCCVQCNEFFHIRTCIFGQFVQDLPLCRRVHKGTLVRHMLPVVLLPRQAAGLFPSGAAEQEKYKSYTICLYPDFRLLCGYTNPVSPSFTASGFFLTKILNFSHIYP